jgi:hypothetical protein
MFGDVPNTYPPGSVFDVGVIASRDGEFVPIRFIHFEAQRIVIDVAGKSSAIDTIYDMLRSTLAEFKIADGSPLIGEPYRVLDYSELIAQCDFPLDRILSPQLRDLYSRTFAGDPQDGQVLVPTIGVQAHKPAETVQAELGVFGFNFAIRAGTRPEEHVYFSSAPLDTDAHVAYLTEFVQAITD